MTSDNLPGAVALGTQHVRLYRTFGFLHMPGIFCDLAETTGSASTRAAETTILGRCHRAARELLGEEAVRVTAEVVTDDPAPAWRRRAERPGSLALAYVLDAGDNCPDVWRFLPRTHRENSGWDDSVHALRESQARLGLRPQDVPCCIVRAAGGDMVAYDPYTLHMVPDGGAADGRRFTLQYTTARLTRD